jgi:hypothetical protein
MSRATGIDQQPVRARMYHIDGSRRVRAASLVESHRAFDSTRLVSVSWLVPPWTTSTDGARMKQ